MKILLYINIQFNFFRHMTVLLFCVLRSGMTTEKKKDPYWFDERHKCWVRVWVVNRDLNSTKPIHVWISGNSKLLDFHTHTDREMWLNRNDIECFNINPNDNLCLNVDYYKSLHWYKSVMTFKYYGNDDKPGIVRMTKGVGKTVFVSDSKYSSSLVLLRLLWSLILRLLR